MRFRIHQFHHLRVTLMTITVFILNRASDKCQKEKRKTINGEDLLWALGTLGFEEYVEPLKLFLAKYRESESSSVRSVEPRREIKQEPSQVDAF